LIGTRTDRRSQRWTALGRDALATAGVDGVAIKPAESDLRRTTTLDVERIVIDFDGHEHVPEPGTLEAIADAARLRVTTPVRADGFDPLGDDSRLAAQPEAAGRVVAGHEAHLDGDEAARAVAPRLRAAAAAATDPWIGTAGVERLALAVGGTQFELLSDTTARDVRALRAAGFRGQVAVYAPTVLSTDPAIAWTPSATTPPGGRTSPGAFPTGRRRTPARPGRPARSSRRPARSMRWPATTRRCAHASRRYGRRAST